MRTISESNARQLANSLLFAMGAKPGHAKVVAEHLVDANLAGHDSHGLVRLPQYHDQIRSGQIRIDSEPSVVRDAPSTALLDGGWTWGPYVAMVATQLAIQKAKTCGIAAVGLRNCAHVGRVGVYPMTAAQEGLLAHVWCNGVGAARVAPWGGTQAKLATNPIAIAIPTNAQPIVIDITTSAVAEGKVRVARNAKVLVPEGWILNAEGKPTTDPRDLYEGGTIVPLGGTLGHKGFALSVAVDVFAGILTSAGCGRMPGVGNGNGMTIVLIDPNAFLDPSEFQKQVDAYTQYLRDSPKRSGVDEILLPGEPELRAATVRRKSGIPIDDGTWSQLQDLANDLNVKLNL